MNAEEQELLERWRARNKQTAPVKRGLSVPDICAGVLVVVALVVIVLSGLSLLGVV